MTGAATAEFGLGRAKSRRARAVGAALAAALLTAGCAAEEILPRTYSDLPESEDVETAPWPRLVDNPASLEESDARERIARGEDIRRELDARVASLETSAELLLQDESAEDDVARRAAAARARGAALMAEE